VISSGLQERINPGLPWLLAGVFKIFGPGAILPAKIAILLMGLGNLLAIFAMFYYAVGRPKAVVATLLVALSENTYHYAFFILTDTPFALGMSLFLAGFARSQKKELGRPWVNWGLMIAGALVMAVFRLVFVTFLVGLMVYLVSRAIRDRRHVKQAASILVVLMLALVVTFMTDPRRSDANKPLFKEKQIIAALSENIVSSISGAVLDRIPNEVSRQTARAMIGINLGSFLPGKIGSIPIALIFITCGVGLLWRYPLWGCLLLVFLGQWILFVFDPRYFLAVQALWVFGFLNGLLWASGKLPSPHAERVLAGFLVAFLIPNLVRVGNFISVQRAGDPLVWYDGGQFGRLPEVGVFVSKNTPEDAVVIVEDDAQTEIVAYLTGRKTMSLADWLDKPTEVDKTYLLTPISPNGHDALNQKATIEYPPLLVEKRPRGNGEWVLHRLSANHLTQ
jgi:hypothetical protein